MGSNGLNGFRSARNGGAAVTDDVTDTVNGVDNGLRSLKPGIFAPIPTFFHPETEDLGVFLSFFFVYHIWPSFPPFPRSGVFRRACHSSGQGRRESASCRVDGRRTPSLPQWKNYIDTNCPSGVRWRRIRRGPHHCWYRRREYSRDCWALQGSRRGWCRLCHCYHQWILLWCFGEQHEGAESIFLRGSR